MKRKGEERKKIYNSLSRLTGYRSFDDRSFLLHINDTMYAFYQILHSHC